MEKTNSAPTGCFKCGRPGHWSRDCPSAAPNSSSNNKFSSSATTAPTHAPKTSAAAEKPKKVPRSRPKLTPEILVSEDGLGSVLRHFPRAFKYRGRGHEVSDLGNLIRLYSDWHSSLLPYYSFDHFVHKVEQVASTKRVKTCVRELRERVARGGDPSKLHEDPIKPDDLNDGQDAMDLDGSNNQQGNTSTKDQVSGDFQDIMLNEIYEKATQESHGEMAGADEFSVGKSRDELEHHWSNNNVDSTAKDVPIMEHQRTIIGTNELKSPEEVAAKSSGEIQITEEQKARMEANKLKALERAAARARSLQGK